MSHFYSNLDVEAAKAFATDHSRKMHSILQQFACSSELLVEGEKACICPKGELISVFSIMNCFYCFGILLMHQLTHGAL